MTVSPLTLSPGPVSASPLRRRRPSWAAWLAAACVTTAAGQIALPAPAAAMTVLQVDLKALVATADLVLHGTVAQTRVVDRRAEGRGVWTEFVLDVAEVWKGDAKKVGPKFAWRHVGGTTPDGITVAVPGMPTFAVGEETVVVLEKHSEGHVVSGGPQGKFSIEKDKLGRKLVRQELHDAHMLRRDPQTGRLAPAPRQVQVLRFLTELRTEVLGYVAAQPARTEAVKARTQVPTKAPVGPARKNPIGK